MSQVDWEGLKALEAKATQGNWWFSKIYGDLIDYKDNEFLAGPFRNDNDALFIAKFREQFPAILAEHERYQRLVAAAEKIRDDARALLNNIRDNNERSVSFCMSMSNLEDALAEYDKAKKL